MYPAHIIEQKEKVTKNSEMGNLSCISLSPYIIFHIRREIVHVLMLNKKHLQQFLREISTLWTLLCALFFIFFWIYEILSDSAGTRGGVPVLLQHGLMSSSFDFLSQLPDKSLSEILFCEIKMPINVIPISQLISVVWNFNFILVYTKHIKRKIAEMRK